ncbi:MAG: DMT family transporter [Paracoccaceae bacterium]
MSFPILLAVLGAALLHALWNGLVRTGSSRVQVMMVLSAVQGLIGLVLALGHDWPGPSVWPWLLASGLVHSAYKVFLTFAYEQGDLSRVYPLARGTAPLLVLTVGSIFVEERLSLPEVTGICLLGAGILLMVSGVFTHGEQRRLIPYALGAAIATASYSMLDGQGARVWGNAGAFVAWMFLLDGLIFAAAMLFLRGVSAVPGRGRVWLLGSAGAAASYASYAIVVWAMTLAPIALVAAMRETSVIFGVLIGWLFLGERMSRSKILSVLLIATGVVVTRL